MEEIGGAIHHKTKNYTYHLYSKVKVLNGILIVGSGGSELEGSSEGSSIPLLKCFRGRLSTVFQKLSGDGT